MISNVLLHVSGENAASKAGPGRYAIGLARDFNAHLTALVFELDVYSPTGADEQLLTAAGRDAVASRNRAAARRADDLRQAAEAAAIATEIRTDAAYVHGVPGFVADYARLNDVTIAGIDDSGLLSERAVAEHVLFEAGRPIIVVPKSYAKDFDCERIVVAWDFSRTAARALQDAMPFLTRASEVAVVAITDDKSLANRLSSDQLVAALAWRGIKARYVERCRGGDAIGARLLSIAHEERADLVVMGGYGHSRWREFVLGGATRDVLANASLPVLLSH